MHTPPSSLSAAPLHCCRSHRRQLGLAAGLAALQALSAGSAAAGTLSQAPLTSQVSQPAKPNVVFTVDDSGSMQVHYMPEGVFQVNGHNVEFPSADININFYMTDGFPGDPTHEGDWRSVGTVSALKTTDENVYQMQFRSPDVNSIFYNPDVSYLPWVKSTGVRYPASNPTAARWEPTGRQGTATFDLTTNKNYADDAYFWMSEPYVRSRTYGEVCGRRTCRVPFSPGLVYRLKADADPREQRSYVRYDINDASAYAPATKHANRSDCVGTRCTQAEERQNFANWFTYYRTRLLLTKASVAEVLNATGNTMRVGIASINTGIVPGNTPQQPINGTPMDVMRLPVGDLTTAKRDQLLENLLSMKSHGGTPLKRALIEVGSNYFMRNDSASPWRDDPGNSDNLAETQCRRSYNILMTDGYYNRDELVIGPAPGNVDRTDGPATHVPAEALKSTKPAVTAPYGYVADEPYQDTASNTLADYAMVYYVNDLRPGLANGVTPIRANAPYWQHLTQFTVGLGVRGELDSRTEPLTAGKSPRQITLEKITDGRLSWPSAINTDPRKIDDLWHAAVNTGGEFFSARNAPELTSALASALGSAAAVNRSEGGVSASSNTLAAGLMKYVPSYQSSVWTGDLKAYRLNLSGNVYTFNTVAEWEAAKKVPAPGQRNLVTFDGSAGHAFDNNMPAALRDRVSSASNQAALINYLRGDKSQEGDVSPSFRRREGPLPDFVNSTPLYVKGQLDEGYSALAGSQGSSYAAHLTAKAARPGVVYLGGNGGFVHAFAEADGSELFAYAPKAVLGNMKELAALDYGTAAHFHRYFVDGPLLEADAYITSRDGGAAGWRNLVIGTLGAGGQAIYGLDVTVPGSLGVNTVQWEFSNADNAAIGNIFTAPEVGRVGGRWMAFFGNGAHSSAGKAVLMAVDLEDRSLQALELEGTLGNNGLMGVRLMRNAASEVYAAYAGDLQGNLWRVDFEGSASVAGWKKSFGGAPLLVAKDADGARQPITVKPTLTAHPDGGFMVLFGTGQLFDSEDSASRTSQSFYGVWDKTLTGVSAATADASSWRDLSDQRSQLLQQVIETPTETGADGRTYYSVSKHVINWTSQRGWYLDVGTAGERVIYPAVTASDFVLVQTMVPADSPAACETSAGKGYNFLLKALSGAQSDKPVFDSNGDGLVNGDDVDGSGYLTDGDGQDIFPTKTPKCLISGSEDTVNCDLGGGELKIRDRVWRQIVNPPLPAE